MQIATIRNTRKKGTLKQEIPLETKRHLVMIKQSINQEDTIIINVYEHNNKSPEYMKQKL